MAGRKMAAGKTGAAHRFFLQAHYAGVAKPAAGCASCRRKQAELSDSGVVAAKCKRPDDAEFKAQQFFFAPAHRSRTYTHTADSANGPPAQNFAAQERQCAR